MMAVHLATLAQRSAALGEVDQLLERPVHQSGVDRANERLGQEPRTKPDSSRVTKTGPYAADKTAPAP
jgi:hypothetical protein